jgi:hypothetical protein
VKDFIFQKPPLFANERGRRNTMPNIWRMLSTTAALTFMLCMTGLVMSGPVFAEPCVDNGDGTVTDTNAGLIWEKESTGPMNWDDAMSYASGLSLGGHSDWRLPDKDELRGLYDSSCLNLMSVEENWYWSSTAHRNIKNLAYLVDFIHGLVLGNLMSESFYVRAVRAGQ